jgi:hypothetical protein
METTLDDVQTRVKRQMASELTSETDMVFASLVNETLDKLLPKHTEV